MRRLGAKLYAIYWSFLKVKKLNQTKYQAGIMANPGRKKEELSSPFVAEEAINYKSCRACTDFKTWTSNIKQSQHKKDNGDIKPSNQIDVQQSGPTEAEIKQVECPLDRQQLGRNSWSVLHTIAAYYPETPTSDQQKEMVQFMSLFTKFYPCEDCSEDFKERLAASPPATESSFKLSQWLCVMHNQVNRKLGKPEFDCSLVDQRWKKGWTDGSCD